MKAQESLQSISGSPTGTFRCRAEQRMGRLCSHMDFTSIKDIIQLGLHDYIDNFQTQLNLVGEAIRDDFFTPHRYRQVESFSDMSQTQTG